MTKKLVLSLSSLVVAAAVAVGGTMAYLNAKTQTMTNTFKTSVTSLSGELREPNWDGYTFEDPGQPDGKTVKTGVDASSLGWTKAQNVAPGSVIPKNPQLRNTSADDVYMAIKVTYSDRQKFNTIASIDENSRNWVKATDADYQAAKVTADLNSDIYFYKGSGSDLAKVVKINGTTESIFNNVTIKSDITDASVISNNMFDITVIGGAVQTSGDITTATAKTELLTLLK